MLQGLKVTMKKHPSTFKLCGELAEKLKTVQDTPLTLYEGINFLPLPTIKSSGTEKPGDEATLYL